MLPPPVIMIQADMERAVEKDKPLRVALARYTAAFEDASRMLPLDAFQQLLKEDEAMLNMPDPVEKLNKATAIIHERLASLAKQCA